MTLIAGMAIGAAATSVLIDLRPWLKAKIRQSWDYIGRIEEV